MTLRDGRTVADPRLDRLIQFDERSRSHPIRATVGGKPQRSYTWRCNQWFDQGREGACVAYALGHELAARPSEVQGLDDPWLMGVYHAAQKADPWPGGSYPGASPSYSGTSVLAGVKVLHSQGWFKSYRWAFGLNDLILGVGYNGPAVIGIAWYEGMYSPDADGFIKPEGPVVGGHAILVRAVNVKDRLFTLRNSWGRDWGRDGDCLVSFDTMDRLLNEQGEAVFLMGRKSRP